MLFWYFPFHFRHLYLTISYCNGVSKDVIGLRAVSKTVEVHLTFQGSFSFLVQVID